MFLFMLQKTKKNDGERYKGRKIDYMQIYYYYYMRCQHSETTSLRHYSWNIYNGTKKTAHEATTTTKKDNTQEEWRLETQSMEWDRGGRQKTKGQLIMKAKRERPR